MAAAEAIFAAGAGSPYLLVWWCGLACCRALTGAGCLSRAPRLGCSRVSCCGTPAAGARACALLQNGAAELSERGRHSRAAWDGSMRLRASYASLVSRSRGLRLAASVLQALARLFGRALCSSLREAEESELSVHTSTYRWPAVLLSSDAETSSTEPVSVGGQKAQLKR